MKTKQIVEVLGNALILLGLPKEEEKDHFYAIAAERLVEQAEEITRLRELTKIASRLEGLGEALNTLEQAILVTRLWTDRY